MVQYYKIFHIVVETFVKLVDNLKTRLSLLEGETGELIQFYDNFLQLIFFSHVNALFYCIF
jgi:hypothetical protein